MLEIMKFYGEKVQLASMRDISWYVVEFSGKRRVYANSLSGPLNEWVCEMSFQIMFIMKTTQFINLCCKKLAVYKSDPRKHAKNN